MEQSDPHRMPLAAHLQLGQPLQADQRLAGTLVVDERRSRDLGLSRQERPQLLAEDVGQLLDGILDVVAVGATVIEKSPEYGGVSSNFMSACRPS